LFKFLFVDRNGKERNLTVGAALQNGLFTHCLPMVHHGRHEAKDERKKFGF
jgi:hypothetical protein